ncbi:NUDIX hydrolase domain-like protein, partial [Flagelloscypha sp. PMI_526]
MATVPRVLSRAPMPLDQAKWITLKKLTYIDQDGIERLWECAERTTRKGDIDAVAIFAIIKSKTSAFEPSTVLVEQYRPPIDKTVIEFPAGLVDQGESPEEAAIRELEEETGYKATSVLHSTSILASDPGMTNANMKLITLAVDLADTLETPQQKLEAGEHIVVKVLPLAKLQEQL